MGRGPGPPQYFTLETCSYMQHRSLYSTLVLYSGSSPAGEEPSYEAIVCYMHASCIWWLQIMWMRQMSLLGFVKSTSSIGCVGAENNAPVDSNAGEPTRPCTSGIDCFGAEDGTSI